jgi:hypothetical protein
MQKMDGGIAYSASDLVNCLECEHTTSLNKAFGQRVKTYQPTTSEAGQ